MRTVKRDYYCSVLKTLRLLIGVNGYTTLDEITTYCSEEEPPTILKTIHANKDKLIFDRRKIIDDNVKEITRFNHWLEGDFFFVDHIESTYKHNRAQYDRPRAILSRDVDVEGQDELIAPNHFNNRKMCPTKAQTQMGNIKVRIAEVELLEGKDIDELHTFSDDKYLDDSSWEKPYVY